mgnify:CR=1 FL=1
MTSLSGVMMLAQCLNLPTSTGIRYSYMLYTPFRVPMVNVSSTQSLYTAVSVDLDIRVHPPQGEFLGLASGDCQQRSIFSVLGAKCKVLDYSSKKMENEKMVSEREGCQIRIIQGDMTKPLLFEDSVIYCHEIR